MVHNASRLLIIWFSGAPQAAIVLARAPSAQHFRVRLFIALYPPPDAAAAMLALLDRLTLARHRRTPAAQVHMTLLFLGERPERELDSVIESIRHAAAGIRPFSLTPTRLITLPERRDPRLVALETDAPSALLELQHRLAQRLAAPDRNRRDRFLAHLTLLRFHNDARASRLDHAATLPAFPIASIHLMNSTLRPGGAQHSEIASIPLSP